MRAPSRTRRPRCSPTPARRRLGHAARARADGCSIRDAADDAAALVRWSCIRVSSRAGPRAPPVVAAAEGIEEDEEVVNGGGASYCGLRARTLAVYTCGTAALWPEAWRIAAVWQSVCAFWGCVASTDRRRRRRPLRAAATECDGAADGAPPRRRLPRRRRRRRRRAARRLCVGAVEGRTLFHPRGARLGAMVRSEVPAAALGPRAVARVSQMTRARLPRGWAAAAGFAPGGVAQLLRGAAKAGQRTSRGR